MYGRKFWFINNKQYSDAINRCNATLAAISQLEKEYNSITNNTKLTTSQKTAAIKKLINGEEPNNILKTPTESIMQQVATNTNKNT